MLNMKYNQSATCQGINNCAVHWQGICQVFVLYAVLTLYLVVSSVYLPFNLTHDVLS